MALQAGSAPGLDSFLVDAWNRGLGIFEAWVDSELGIGEVRLANENAQHAAAIAASQAPAAAELVPGLPNMALAIIGGGLALVAVLLLSR